MSDQRVRLRAIVPEVDFRCSELTNFREWHKKNPIELNHGDAVLMVSSGGGQLVFVLHFRKLETGTKNDHYFIDTRRFRITIGTWEPLKLQDYAQECGLELIGIKPFKQIMADREARKKLAS